MPSITNLVATTETEALNVMLSAIGEAPVANIDTATAADVVMAKAIFRRTAKDVLAKRWRFNTEFGYELAPTNTLAWTGSDGVSVTLNVWEVPTNLVRFTVSPTTKQLSEGIDLVARISSAYENPPGTKKMVFYDRARNRDGLNAAQFPVLYIDPVWYFDFETCPESIRNLITITAARRLIKDAVNSAELQGFEAADEVLAWRIAKDDQGEEDNFNMLKEISVGSVLGGRLSRGYGRPDYRNSPRKV